MGEKNPQTNQKTKTHQNLNRTLRLNVIVFVDLKELVT